MAYSLSYTKAILVLVFIHDKIQRDETDFISAKVMSETLSIPRPTLSLIFSNLIRAGILESKEGINGGVRFAKEPQTITLLDILEATEGQKSLFQTSFTIKAQAKRPDEVIKAVAQKLHATENIMKQSLKNITLKEILETS